MVRAYENSVKYYGTYYVEILNQGGIVTVYDVVSGNSPLEVAKHFKPDAIKCDKQHSTIFVVSNAWRFGEKVKNNYYM